MKNYYMCIYIYVIHSNTSLIRTIYYFCSYPPKKKTYTDVSKKCSKVFTIPPFTQQPASLPPPYPFEPPLLDGFEILRCKESEHLARLPWFLIHRLCGSHLLLGSLSLGRLFCRRFLEMFRKPFPPGFGRAGGSFWRTGGIPPKIWGIPRVFGSAGGNAWLLGITSTPSRDGGATGAHLPRVYPRDALINLIKSNLPCRCYQVFTL